MKWIHIHGPLPATDIAAPIQRGLHTDWIVPEILYQTHTQNDSLITKCKYILPWKYSKHTPVVLSFFRSLKDSVC